MFQSLLFNYFSFETSCGCINNFQASKNAGKPSTGKRAAKTYERPGLSEEEIEEIREAFNLFDTDGSGKQSYTCIINTAFVALSK